MDHGASHAFGPAPRADLLLSRDCKECWGWGTVVTLDGRHELCPVCQTTEQHTTTVATAAHAHKA
ncbi:hypothetical protein ACWGI9_10210 [Streptomyces sp. NPDC054833]|jgi:hypothetical protein